MKVRLRQNFECRFQVIRRNQWHVMFGVGMLDFGYIAAHTEALIKVQNRLNGEED